MAENASGKVSQVLGAVVDVAFSGELPEIYTALACSNAGIDDRDIDPDTERLRALDGAGDDAIGLC